MAYLFVYLFCWFVCGITDVACFARVAISSNLKRNIDYRTTGWQKVTAWHTPLGSGHMRSSASLSNGEFKAASSGLYNVFTTMTFSGAENGLFKVGVFINNDEQNTHPGLFSTFESAPGFRSVSVFSTLRLQAGNTVSVHVYSANDTDWTLIGSSESTFAIEFVGFFSYVPGFSAYLMRTHTTDATEWSQILRWRAYGIPGLFRSRTGFSEDIGAFVPICDGIYQISASLRFSHAEVGKFEIGIAINGDPTGSIVTHDGELADSTFSLSISLSLKLLAGDEVTLVVKGTASFTVESDSSFSGILINEGGAVQGFSTVFFAPVEGTGQRWINVPIPVPTTTYGQFEAVPGSINAGKYYHTHLQIFTISAIINIEASSSTGAFVTLHSDGSALNVVRTGVYATKESGKSVVSYSLTGILELPADTPLRLFIKLDNQETYSVLPGSRISVATSQQDYQAFHIAAPAPFPATVRNTWVKLDNLAVTGSGSYSFTGKLKDGGYTAGITGIYYLCANIIFQDPNGPISITISLNGDTSKRRSLYATKGNPAAVQDSLSVAGALNVRKGETISVHVMVDNDVSWSVASESSFSVVFIGQHFAVTGFSTVLTYKVPVTVASWVKVNDWLKQGVTGSMFSSGGGFDNAAGNYVSPHSGLYLVSVSLKIQDGSLKDSKFQMTITVNGNPDMYLDQNGVQDYIEHKFTPSSNDYYCLVASGVIKADMGHNISVWVKSVGDRSYGISQDSSFSIIYLSPMDSIYASGASLMLDRSISQSKKQATGWKKILYWRKARPYTAPGVFQTGNLLVLDSNAGKMFILESGIYSVCVTVSIKAEYNSDDDIVGDFELAVHTKTGPAALITKYTKTIRNVFTMKVFGIMYLSAQTELSVKVRSSTPSATWENLRPHSSFSIVRIPPFPVPPSVISGLPETKRIWTKQGFWSRIQGWDVNKASTQELAGSGFYGKDGFLTAMYTGIYFISTSLTVTSNITDFYVRMKIGLNGDTSSPGSMVIDSSKGATHMISNCNQDCARPVTSVMSLTAGDNVAVYVQSNAAYLDLSHSTSFTVKYLSPLQPLPDGFSMQIKNSELVTVRGDKQVTGWHLKENSGNYIKVSGDSNDEYSITMSGLYFVSINIEFIGVSGLVRAMPSINSIPAFSSATFSTKDESLTISVAGIMKINAGSVFTVIVFTESDPEYRISDLSTSAMTYIGPAGDTPGFTATRNLQELLRLPQGEWERITSWSTSGKDYLFRIGSGFESKTSYIVQESGFYICSINLMFKSASNVTSVIELALVHNNINNFDNGLYAKSVIYAGGTATLQAVGGISLGVWDFLEVQVRSSETLIDAVLEQESTFSIVKFGDDLSAVNCLDMGPNIVGKLIPDNIRLPRGDEISWVCFATGTAPSYQWSKDFQNVAGGTGTKFELMNLKVVDSGKYICSATAGGVTVASNIATVVVFEPLPIFLNPVGEYTIRTPENGDPNLILLDIKAKAESHATSAEEMNFRILSGDAKQQFEISPLSASSGTVLSRVKTLDREDIESYTLFISAVNIQKSNEPVVQNITVIVTDLNDNVPIFEQNVYKTTVLEDITNGTIIIKVSATDKDIGKNAVIRYSIIPGTAEHVFSIDSVTGVITLAETIDREKRDEYVLFISADDGVFSSYTELYIYVADVNEHKPTFLKNDYSVEVFESVSSMVPIAHLLAEDKDTGDNARIVYDIISGDSGNQFVISEKGELSVRQNLDYETNSSYHLVVMLRDSGTPPLHSDDNATVFIAVRNTNDNRPRFTLPKYLFHAKENSLRFEKEPVKVIAVDPDGGIGHISYRIQDDGNITEIFEISYLTGLVQIIQPMDFEERKYYQFTVEASDNDGTTPRVSAVDVVVMLMDANDNRPYFTDTYAEVTIVESTASNRIVYTVNANDKDSNENGHINYRIADGNTNDQFYINPFSGAVTTQQATDREQMASYTLNITAYDSGVPSLTSSNSFILIVNIKDANDNAPIFDQKSYTASVREDALLNTVILTMTIQDLDLGIHKQFDVSILEPAFRDRFTVLYKSNNVYELVLKTALNFEERNVYQFTLSARDRGNPPLESSVPITVDIEDVNDNRPEFSKTTYLTTLVDNPVANLTVFQLTASDLDIGPAGRLTYQIVDGNDGNAFSITEHSGIVRTNVPQNAVFSPLYKLKIVAKDSYDPPLVSDVVELFVRISHIPTIQFMDIDIGQFQLSGTIHLKEFSHLMNAHRIQVLVQQYHEDNVLLNTYATEPPSTWYTVFVSESHPHNHLRRWVAIEEFFPLNNKNRKRRTASDGGGNSIAEDETMKVIIGNGIRCTEQMDDIYLICNGPLAAGQSYRLQVQVYEDGSLMPIESHFSQPLTIPSILPAKATLEESPADGMLALGATFALVYLVVLLVIFIYVCWKRTHEIVHVDHLKENRGQFPITEENRFSQLHPTTSYFSPRTGRLHKFGGTEGNGLWPGMSITEQNQMIQRSDELMGQDNRVRGQIRGFQGGYDNHQYEPDEMIYGKEWTGFGDDAHNMTDDDMESLYATAADITPGNQTSHNKSGNGHKAIPPESNGGGVENKNVRFEERNNVILDGSPRDDDSVDSSKAIYI